MIRLLIADDKQIVIDNLIVLLSNQKDILVDDFALNGLEALEKTMNILPDIVLLDLDMPYMSGIEVAKIIKREHADIKIILFTSLSDGKTIISAIKSGVEGYITKDIYGEELINMIKSIYQGSHVLSKRAGKALAEELIKCNNGANLSFERLRDDEMELIILICDGKTDKAIATKLNKDESSVKKDIAALMKKAGVTSRGHFITWAIKNRLL